MLTCNNNYDMGINNFLMTFTKIFMRVDMFRNVKLKAQRLSHFIMQMAVRTQETQAYTTMIFLACSRINPFFMTLLYYFWYQKVLQRGYFYENMGFHFLIIDNPQDHNDE